jgi:hypothetical protein
VPGRGGDPQPRRTLPRWVTLRRNRGNLRHAAAWLAAGAQFGLKLLAMEPGCEQYLRARAGRGRADEVARSLKFAAAKAITGTPVEAGRSSSCIRPTSTYGGYRAFAKFDF